MISNILCLPLLCVSASDNGVRLISCGVDKSIYFRTAHKVEKKWRKGAFVLFISLKVKSFPVSTWHTVTAGTRNPAGPPRLCNWLHERRLLSLSCSTFASGLLGHFFLLGHCCISQNTELRHILSRRHSDSGAFLCGTMSAGLVSRHHESCAIFVVFGAESDAGSALRSHAGL